MFLVVASVMAVFAFSFEKAKQTECGPGDQVSVLFANEQPVAVQQLQPPAVLPSNKAERLTLLAEARGTFAPPSISIDEAPDIYELQLAQVKTKSKENIYNGFGYEHNPRADV